MASDTNVRTPPPAYEEAPGNRLPPYVEFGPNNAPPPYEDHSSTAPASARRSGAQRTTVASGANGIRQILSSISGAVGYHRQTPDGQTAAGAAQQRQEFTPLNGRQPAVVAQRQPVDSYSKHVVLACLVTCLTCNILLGAIACALAMAAQSKASTSRKEAQKLGRASVVVSVAGIVVSVIIVVVIVVATTAPASESCTYKRFSACYRYRASVSNSTACKNYYGPDAHYEYSSYFDDTDGYCYYNVEPTLTATSTIAPPSCEYYRAGTCYPYRVFAGKSDSCRRNYGDQSQYDDNCCYTTSRQATDSLSTTYYIGGVCYGFRVYASSSGNCEVNYGSSSSHYDGNFCCYTTNERASTLASTTYYKDGTCYRYRVYSSNSQSCARNYGSDYQHEKNCCYTNNERASDPSDDTLHAAGACYLYRVYARSSGSCAVNYGNGSHYVDECCYSNNALASSSSSTTYYQAGSCYPYRAYAESAGDCIDDYGLNTHYVSKEGCCYYKSTAGTPHGILSTYYKSGHCYRSASH